MLNTTALLTDRYELTMLQAALRSGKAHRKTVFEVFARSLAGERRYGVVAGTGRLLQAIKDFRFEKTEIEWLLAQEVIDQATANWLLNYRFTGNIWGYQEGEIYFPYSPVLIVEASFAEAVILETLILSILNFDTSVASAAARMITAAGGRRVSEMGSRRTAEYSAVAAARAAYIAGFSATSNLEAGRSYGIPTMGTASHAFTLLHEKEQEAFRAQLDAFGEDTTFLVDTYNIESGIRNAIEVAGPKLGGVRIDSGDLPIEVAKARALLESLGAAQTKITVTNDLNEFAIAALAAAPVDAYGVGTSVVTGSGVPAAGFVYKMVAYENDQGEWLSVSKQSAKKTNLGGRKHALRRHDETGVAISEIVVAGEKPQANERDRYLLVSLVKAGEIQSEYIAKAGVEKARAHHAQVKLNLPTEAHRLTKGNPAIPTIFI
ncbi:MAG: nicotinate phosphoribosyltransferase [Actinomycetota bacterium]